MLMIRLSRVGKKKQPEYRVIVNEKHKDPWGDVLEYLGYYNPRTNPATIQLNVDRIKHWLARGAQASDTVYNILLDQKIVTGKKIKPTGIRRKRKAAAEKEKAQSEEKTADADQKGNTKPPEKKTDTVAEPQS